MNRLKKIRKTQWDEIRRDLVFITKIYFVCLKYYIWKNIFGGPSRFPLLWLSIIVILLLSKAEVLYHNLDLLVMCVLLSLLLLLWTVITGICWEITDDMMLERNFLVEKHILHDTKLADFVRIIHIFTPVQNLDLFTKTSKVRQKDCEHYLFENRKC